MPIAQVNGVSLCFDTLGKPTDRCLLLLMGLGAQMIGWREPFMKLFVERGFFVVRYDHRDTGLSTHFDGQAPHLEEVMGGDHAAAPYNLSDLARDAVGLLDHLGVEKAHLVGASMGGMVAQVMAIEHAARVASLCSIMSTTGNPEVGAPTPEALGVLLAPPAENREGALLNSVASARVIGSKTYPVAEDLLRERSGLAYDRAFYPQGGGRHLAAVLASGDRTAALCGLTVPTLAIHGDEDTLIDISGGEATAAAIPGAHFLRLHGMGHDLPEQLWPQAVDAIVANADRAR